MKFIVVMSLFVSSAAFAGRNDDSLLKARCAPQTASDQVLMTRDFHWDYDLAGLLQKFADVVMGAKRLDRRASWDAAKNGVVLPYEASRGGSVKIPAIFIKSVQRHVEEAFRSGYVDGLFFPDMGHSHFLIPDAKWAVYQRMPVAEISKFYEQVMADPDLLVVYHTAEQLRMRQPDGRLVDDRHVQWRFFSRNLIGDNRGEGRLELHQEPTHSYNTMSGLEGYYWYGAGFNISANKDGCFAALVHGKELRYDLSLYDLPEPAGEEIDP